MVGGRRTATCSVHVVAVGCCGGRGYGPMGGVCTAPACAWAAQLVSSSHGGMYSSEVAHHAFILLLLVSMYSLRVLTEVV